MRALGAAAVLLSTLAGVQAAGAATQCASKPSRAPGYQVKSVHADNLTAPPTTPPIAVLDSGIGPVPELEGRVRKGANLVRPGAGTGDTDGHGTAVAIVAAGAVGPVQGIAPTAPVIPITILDARGETSTADVVAGIGRAVALGARVINASLAATPSMSTPSDDRALQNAIFAAVTRGVAVIAPSGNEGATSLDVPARYPHVISVGATDEVGGAADFSNSGLGLDLVAPGAAITTAVPTAVCASGYGLVGGTSFAAPAISGAAALLFQQHPELDVQQLTEMLRQSAGGPSPSAWSPSLGFGMLNVANALTTVIPPRADGEVNDDIEWADRRPAVLSPALRSRTLAGRVTPRLDPADVYRLRLKKGDRFRVRLSAGAGVRLRLSFGRKGVAPTRGRLERKIVTSGTYHIGVAIQRAPDAGADYSLSLKRG